MYLKLVLSSSLYNIFFSLKKKIENFKVYMCSNIFLPLFDFTLKRNTNVTF